MFVLPPSPHRTRSFGATKDIKGKSSDSGDQGSVGGGGGWISKIGSRLVDRIDNSVLGVNAPQQASEAREPPPPTGPAPTPAPQIAVATESSSRQPSHSMTRRGSFTSMTARNVPKPKPVPPKNAPSNSDDRSVESNNQNDASVSCAALLCLSLLLFYLKYASHILLGLFPVILDSLEDASTATARETDAISERKRITQVKLNFN
jgi:hypothetical protein